MVASTFRNAGRDWRIVVVKGPLSGPELIGLAKDLRYVYRDESIEIFDDASQVKAYENWTVNYPDPRYPYPEAWVNKHHLGMINLMLTAGGARWYLVGGAAHPTRPEERIIELP